jgi:hypothetical protein
MTWEFWDYLGAWQAQDGNVTLEVWAETEFWGFAVTLECCWMINSPALYDTADAAKLAAQHALEIWRKGEKA